MVKVDISEMSGDIAGVVDTLIDNAEIHERTGFSVISVTTLKALLRPLNAKYSGMANRGEKISNVVRALAQEYLNEHGFEIVSSEHAPDISTEGGAYVKK